MIVTLKRYRLFSFDSNRLFCLFPIIEKFIFHNIDRSRNIHQSLIVLRFFFSSFLSRLWICLYSLVSFLKISKTIMGKLRASLKCEQHGNFFLLQTFYNFPGTGQFGLSCNSFRPVEGSKLNTNWRLLCNDMYWDKNITLFNI